MARALFTTSPLGPGEELLLRSSGIEFQIEPADLTNDEIGRALRGKDAYILGGVESVQAATLEAATDLKVVAFMGVGYHAVIDADAATRLGVAVTNAPGSNARAVAEFTIGLILDAVRRTTYLANRTKTGAWPEYRSHNLEGRTLGILGMGTIGSMVAEIAHAGLGMSIVYHSRVAKADVDGRFDARCVSFEELLARADVLSLHASFNPQTHGVVGEEALGRVRPGTVIVNTSEAELIDPEALRAAIGSGRLGCVAMDGYYVEPVPGPEDDPYGLLSLPDDRFIVLPHTAFHTSESIERALTTNLTSIANVLETGDDDRIVNPEFRRQATWIPPRALTSASTTSAIR